MSLIGYISIDSFLAYGFIIIIGLGLVIVNIHIMSVFEFTKLRAYGFPKQFSGLKIKRRRLDMEHRETTTRMLFYWDLCLLLPHLF